MEAVREIVTVPRSRETGRWALCIALAFAIHTAAAAALIARWSAEPEQVANAPLIMVQLETLPVAPDMKPTQAPPGPQQRQAMAEPQPPIEHDAQPTPEQQPEKAGPLAPQALQGELVTAALPPPKPVEKTIEAPADQPVEKAAEKPAEKANDKTVGRKHHSRRASLASAPSPAEKHADRAAAPAPGASSHNPSALPNWRSELVSRLERAKRYPPEAQARGEHGVAQLAFSVDRRGGVHHARIARSSGSSLLDSATLAMVERAAPLPPPPAELAGPQIAISVPIRYDMR